MDFIVGILLIALICSLLPFVLIFIWLGIVKASALILLGLAIATDKITGDDTSPQLKGVIFSWLIAAIVIGAFIGAIILFFTLFP